MTPKKTNYYLKIILSILFVLQSFSVRATHFMGGEITYECLGGNQYRITLNVYRDCGGSNSLSGAINISSASCGINYQETLDLQSRREVSALCPAELSQSTCNGGLLPGVEQYIYSKVITLPANCSDWVFGQTFINRNAAVTNLQQAGGQSMYIRATLDNSDPTTCNSSPTFSNLPVPYVCQNEPVFFNHGVVESDGDSLVYRLINPLRDATILVPYNTGFTPDYPILTNSGTFGFSSTDGSMEFTPLNGVNQQSVITMEVEEYRNGVLVGSIMRDVQIVVRPCTNNLPELPNGGITNFTGDGNLVDPHNIEVCVGDNLEFDIEVEDPDAAETLSILSNISTVFPGATITESGTNPVLFHVEWTATGTTGLKTFTLEARDNACPIPSIQVFTFNINLLGGTDAGPDGNYCIGNTPAQLQASGGSNFNWSPATGLSCTNCANPLASPGVTTVYTVTSDLGGGCSNVDQVTVFATTGSPVNTSTITGPTAVCPGTGSVMYSVTNTAGSSYDWNIPPAGAIISGNGTNTITVNWSSVIDGDVSVVETNSDGCLGDAENLAVTIGGPPTNSITGPTFICKNALGDSYLSNYSTTGPPSVNFPFNNPPDPVADAGRSFYEWNVVLGGATLSSTAVNSGSSTAFNTSFAGYEGPVVLQVIEVDDQGCRHQPATIEIEIVAKPPTPSLIAPNNVCPGDTISFSASPGDDFIWDFPSSDIDILSGDSSNFVTVVWGNSTEYVAVTAGLPSCLSDIPVGQNVAVQPLSISNLSNSFSSCGNTFRVQQFSPGSYVHGTQSWTIPFGFTASGGGDGQNYVDLTQNSPDCYTGNICLTAANNYGCRDTVCTNVAGNPLPCNDPGTVSISPVNPGPQCERSTVTLTGTATGIIPTGGFEYEFFYDNGSGAVSIAGPSDVDSVNAMQTGDYYVVVTDPADPTTCMVQSGITTVTFDTVPSTANAGSDDSYCAPSYALNANTPTVGSGEWSLISGLGVIGSINDPQSNLTVTVDTSATLVWTISNGTCPDETDTVTITNNCPPCTNPGSVTLTPTDSLTICNSDTLLTATPTNAAPSGGFNYVFFQNNSIVQGPNNSNQFLASNTDSYYALAYDPSDSLNCYALSDTLTLTINTPIGSISASADTTICLGGTASLSATPLNSGESGTWSVVSGAGTFSSPMAEVTNVSGAFVDTNTYRWTVSKTACPDTSVTTIVIVDTLPDVSNAGTDTSICTNQYQLAANSISIGTGYWDVISGPGTLADSSNRTETVMGLQDGINELVWITENGVCPFNADTLEITKVGSLTIPNAGIDDTICATTTPFNLTANAVNALNGETGTWSFTTGSANISNLNAPTATIDTYTDSLITMRWTIGNGVCPSTFDEVTIHINATPSTPNAGTDTSICTDQYQLSANLLSIGNGHWSVISGPGTLVDSSNHMSTVTGLQDGINELVWVARNGVCPYISDTLEITKVGSLTSPIAGMDDTICETTTPYSLSANVVNALNSETGTWSFTTGSANISNLNDPLATIDNYNDTLITLRWTIENGTCPAAYDEVTIHINRNPGTATVANDTSICGDQFALVGNVALAGTSSWSLLNGNGMIANPSSSSTNITALDGISSIAYSFVNGRCFSSDTIEITATSNAVPDVQLNVSDNLICQGDSIHFTASNSGPLNNGTTPTYEFFQSGISVQGPSLVNTYSTASYSNNEDLTVVLRPSLLCTTIDSVTATQTANVSSPPSVMLSPISDTTVCENNNYLLTANSSTNTTLAWYQIIGGGTATVISGETSPTLSTFQTGEYFFVVSNTDLTCEDAISDTVSVSFDQLPTVNAGSDRSIFLDEQINLNGTVTNAASSVWSLNSGEFDDITNPTSTYTALIPGVNNYTLTAINGTCTAQDNLEIIVKVPIKIPEGISPNGDGLNEEWIIEGLEAYDRVNIKVFNRWGSLIYQSFENNEWWDGTRNGIPVPVATYYYVITVQEGVNTPQEFVGSITVLR